MYRLGMVFEDFEIEKDLQGVIASSHEFQPIHYQSGRRVTLDIQRKKLQGLVLVIHSVNQKHIELVEKFTQKFPLTPIVILCGHVSKLHKKWVRSHGLADLLHVPQESLLIVPRIKSLMRRKGALARVHERYPTWLGINVQKNNKEYQCTMNNLSFGGALLRSVGNNFEVGDEVLVEVPLREMKRTYQVKAMVVWSHSGGAGQSQTMGLCFAKNLADHSEADFKARVPAA